MSATGRILLATLGALVVAFVVVFLIEALGARVAPVPEGVDVTDPAQLKAALEMGQVPFTALAMVAAGWLLGAYAGGMTAWRLARTGGAVWLFAFCFTAVILLQLLAIPHPTWMWITGVVAAPLFALGAGGRSISLRT